jgi:F-box-like
LCEVCVICCITFIFFLQVYFQLRLCWALLFVSIASDKSVLEAARMNNFDDEGYNKFPDEVLLNILSHLTHDNFLNVRLVNRQWNKVSYDVSLWRKVSFQAYFNMITIPENWKDQIWNAIIMISS